MNAINVPFASVSVSHTDFKGVPYWAGWILAYYQWETGRRFENIVNDGLALSTIFSMYILHEADVSKFVETANEMIAHNKQNRKSKLSQIRRSRGFTQAELADASGITLRMGKDSILLLLFLHYRSILVCGLEKEMRL